VAYLTVRAIVLHGMAPGTKFAPPATAIATWPAVLWFYVHKLAAPWPLSLDYAVGFTSHIGLRNFWLPSAALLAIGAGLWAWFRRNRRVAMPCAWLLIPLLPAVAGTLRFAQGQLVHDRYLYLPLVGFAMLCALALRQLPSLVQVTALLIILGVFGIATAIYIGNWSSDMAIYSHAVTVAPGNAYAHNSVAEQLFNRGRFDEAFDQFKQALAIDPENAYAHTCLGQAYGYFGKWAEAIPQMRMAAQLANSACAYINLADTQRRAGQLPEAEASLRQALALPPCPPHTHWTMAELLRQEGKLAEARAEYQAELAEPSENPVPDVSQQIDELDQLLRLPASR
jgi:cytochrome c-type biogenesis protein CcmH/NrfG